MNLRGIQYFAAVAQTRSFTEAASHLNVAQPAVSRQIQNLEGELGVELLKRSRGGVQLTGAGTFFLDRVLPLLVQLNQAKELLSRQSKAQVEDTVIGLTAGEGLAVAPMLFERWAEVFPAANLKIVPALAPSIYSGIKDGSINIGVAPEPLAFEGIWTRPLFEEPLVLIAPHNPTLPMPNLDLLDTADVSAILKLPLLAPSNLNPLREKINQLSQLEGVEANVILELDSMTLMKDLVRRGSGCAFCTYAYLVNEVEHDIVKIIPLDFSDMWRSVSLFGSLSEDGSTPNTIAIDFIQDLVVDTVKAGLWPGARLLKDHGG